MFYPVVYTTILTFRSDPHSLLTDAKYLASFGPVFAQYRPSRAYFTLLLLVTVVIKSLIIAVASTHGEVQVISMIVVESFIFLIYLVLRPCNDKGANMFGIYLAFTRLLAAGLMVPFIERLAFEAIPRVVIGIVIAVLFSVSVIVSAVTIFIHAFKEIRSFLRRRHSENVQLDELRSSKSDLDARSDVELGSSLQTQQLQSTVHQSVFTAVG